MEKEKFIKVCPNCGSTNVGLPNLKSFIYRMGSIFQPVVSSGLSRCNGCNYHGIFVEVEKGKIGEFRKRLKKPKNKGDKLLFG